MLELRPSCECCDRALPNGDPDARICTFECTFCRDCGTPLGFAFPDSENMDLTVASFDDPSPFAPKHHFGAESLHRPWLNTEGLPEKRTDSYQPLVDKWVEATGKFPG